MLIVSNGSGLITETNRANELWGQVRALLRVAMLYDRPVNTGVLRLLVLGRLFSSLSRLHVGFE